MNVLKVVGRNKELFGADIERFSGELTHKVAKSKFLVIGGAGSIGQAVTKRFLSVIPRHSTL